MNQVPHEVQGAARSVNASESAELLKRACEDWAEDDTAIKAIAERHDINTDPTPGYFTSRVAVMEEMSKRLTDAIKVIDDIRCLTGIHYCGGAFDPEHMRSISNYLSGFLNGGANDISDSPRFAIVEQPEARNAVLKSACEKSYSVLSMLPAKEFWNGRDAADSFDGSYGAKMREKFDAAWNELTEAL